MVTRDEFVAGVSLILIAECSNGFWYRFEWGEKLIYVMGNSDGSWLMSKNGFRTSQHDDAAALAASLWEEWGKRDIPEVTRQ